MTPSRTALTPQPGDRLVAAIEAQTVAIERAMVKAFWTQIVGLTVIMAVAMNGVRGRGEGRLRPSTR